MPAPPAAADRDEGVAVDTVVVGHEAEEMAADRYRVVRGAFWWRVKIGDGQQTVGRCYTEAEAERLAAALRTSFLDGAFVVAQQVAEEQRLRAAIKGLGELVREQSRSRIAPAPHA